MNLEGLYHAEGPCLAMQIREPVLASFLHQNIISHSSLGKAMAVLLANKLSSRTLLGTQLMQLISEAYKADPVRLCSTSRGIALVLLFTCTLRKRHVVHHDAWQLVCQALCQG